MELEREAQRTAGDFERFDFTWSAFVNAGRNVTFSLQKENKIEYDAWFPGWGSFEDRDLLRFMNERRVDEVKRGGAKTEIRDEGIPLWGTYEDEFGRWDVFAPPPALTGALGPPATIYRPVRCFRIGERLRPVVEVCRAYLDVLERLVHEFGGTE